MKANLTSSQVPPFHGLEHDLQILLGWHSVLTCGQNPSVDFDEHAKYGIHVS